MKSSIYVNWQSFEVRKFSVISFVLIAFANHKYCITLCLWCHWYLCKYCKYNISSIITPIQKIFAFKVYVAILRLKSVRYQQRHNPVAYMIYWCIYLILSLQCIIGWFSNMAVIGCFVSKEILCCHVWSRLLMIKANQDQSSCWFSFNLLYICCKGWCLPFLVSSLRGLSLDCVCFSPSSNPWSSSNTAKTEIQSIIIKQKITQIQ